MVNIRIMDILPSMGRILTLVFLITILENLKQISSSINMDPTITIKNARMINIMVANAI